ncbi:MAG TPA: hypothetical protein PKK03_09225 [Bacteroidales bacterium]|nr:hypothetical protein [Bacteroidales bacterium]
MSESEGDLRLMSNMITSEGSIIDPAALMEFAEIPDSACDPGERGRIDFLSSDKLSRIKKESDNNE